MEYLYNYYAYFNCLASDIITSQKNKIKIKTLDCFKYHHVLLYSFVELVNRIHKLSSSFYEIYLQ